MSSGWKFFENIKRPGSRLPSAGDARADIPVVRFDASRVTDAVKADLWSNILHLEGLDQASAEQIYCATLRSISAGRDLSVLKDAVLQSKISGMTARRAAEIALLLNSKATAILDRERQISIGVTQAHWLHSGAPCEVNPKSPTGQDAIHRTANGQLFDVAEGLLLNGKRTWPGVEPGCRCISKSVIPGFS